MMEAVRVTAADYANGEFDGLPFDGIPLWLRIAIIDRRINIVPKTDTDYAVWSVSTKFGHKVVATPGTYIIYDHGDGSLQVMEREEFVNFVMHS